MAIYFNPFVIEISSRGIASQIPRGTRLGWKKSWNLERKQDVQLTAGLIGTYLPTAYGYSIKLHP